VIQHRATEQIQYKSSKISMVAFPIHYFDKYATFL